MPEKIFVHIDLAGKSHFVGRLWLHERHGRESASFEYSSAWKSSPVCFPLEPALIVDEGRFHIGKVFFGSISDSAPDRWGRSLMNRMEIRKAKIENRLKEIADYVEEQTKLIPKHNLDKIRKKVNTIK